MLPACRIIDLSPEVCSDIQTGEKAGLGTYHVENIEIVGEPLAAFIDKSFNVNPHHPDACG